MPKPKVIETLDAFKAEVRNNEKDAMLLMAKRWNAVERGLDAQIAALTQEIDALRAIDKLPTANQLYRMERYKTLLAQTQREVGQYERFAQGEIERGQRDYFALGNDAAQAMLRDLTPVGVNINFNRLPVDAVNNMIGYCKDGAPLFSVLKERALYPDAVDGLTTQLVNAMALGYSPRKTALLMKDGLAQGLTKALVIARTEQLRAFREASFQNYNKNSDIVKGWIWHSALGDRTCAACYAMHGTEHPLSERLEDHPSGRCAMIPVSKGWAALGYDVPDTNPKIPSGEEEFAKLDEKQQLAVLGKGRFELYKAGKLDFGKMATFTDDKVWGRSLRIAPLGDIAKSKIGSNYSLDDYKNIIKDVVGVIPDINSIKSISDDEFNNLMKNDYGQVININNIAAVNHKNSITFREGYEDSALHEFIHSAGFYPDWKNDGIHPSINEGLTQACTEYIGNKYNIVNRSGYTSEVDYVKNYIIRLSGVDEVKFYKGYANAENKQQYVANLLWEKHGDKFSTEEWGVAIKERFNRSVATYPRGDAYLEYLVDELKL